MFPTKKTNSQDVTPQAVTQIAFDKPSTNTELEAEVLKKIIKGLLFKVNKQEKEINLLKSELLNLKTNLKEIENDTENKLLNLEIEEEIEEEIEVNNIAEKDDDTKELITLDETTIINLEVIPQKIVWSDVKDNLIKSTPEDLLNVMSLELSCNILGINSSWCYTDMDIEKFYYDAYETNSELNEQNNLLLKNFKKEEIVTSAYLYLLNWNFIPY